LTGVGKARARACRSRKRWVSLPLNPSYRTTGLTYPADRQLGNAAAARDQASASRLTVLRSARVRGEIRRDPGFSTRRFARLDDRLDRIDRKLDAVNTRLGIVERDFAGMKMDFAAMNLRLDNISRRFDRVERRLELADEHALPGET
jgi:tetrahydromethanopterin S-methyltransferase subunit G